MFLSAGLQLLRLILIWKGFIAGLAAGVSLHIISEICLRMFCYSCWLCAEDVNTTAAVIRDSADVHNCCIFMIKLQSMWLATTRLPVSGSDPSIRTDAGALFTSPSPPPAAFPPSSDLLHMCLPWALSTQTSLYTAGSTSHSSVLRQRGSCLFLLTIHRETER